MDENCSNYGSSFCHDFDCGEDCPGRVYHCGECGQELESLVTRHTFEDCEAHKLKKASRIGLGIFEEAVTRVEKRKEELMQAVSRAETQAEAIITGARHSILNYDTREALNYLEGRNNIVWKDNG